MAKKTAPLLPSTEALLTQFGDRLRLARQRRRLAAKQVAQRAGMSPMTLRSLERGGSGVTMGAYLAVMQVLGMEDDLGLLCKADPQGRELQDARLPPASKKVARAVPTTRMSVSKLNRSEPVGNAVAQRHQVMGSSPQEQLRKVMENSPQEQLRKAMENSPQEQLRKVMENSPQEQLRKAMENSPQEQLRKVMENSPQEQLRKVMGSSPQEQLRADLDESEAPSRDIKRLLKSAENAQSWREQSGFADSETLAGLIHPLEPFSKKRR